MQLVTVMPDELLPIGLAMSAALMIVLSSVADWRRRRHAPMALAATPEDALARSLDDVIASLEPPDAPTTVRGRVVILQSLLHPGALVSFAMQRPARRSRPVQRERIAP